MTSNHSARRTHRRSFGLRRLVESLEPRLLLSSPDPYYSLPGLIIDVRLPDGAKSLANVSPGQTINLEVFATVVGANDSPKEEALQSVHGSFLSTNIDGGAASGSLSASPCAPFDASGFTDGTPTDLDSDGDFDVGNNNDLSPIGFFVARAGKLQRSGGTIVGNARAFKIGDLTFTVDHLLPGLQTQINFRPRKDAPAALWVDDTSCSTSSGESGFIRTGAPVIIGSAAAPDSTPVEPSPFVNHAPFFVPTLHVTAKADAGPQTIPHWATHIYAGPQSESGQALSFHVSVSHPTLFLVPPAVSPDGTLTFTPHPDAEGTTTIYVVLTDDAGRDNGGADTSPRFAPLLTIDPVNHRPTFAFNPQHLVATVTVPQNGGPQSVPRWLTGISPGAPEEAGQTLTFRLTFDTPTLFISQPAISLDGTLTFTPNPSVFGKAQIIVALQDDGAPNGKPATSYTWMFWIDTRNVNDPPSFTVGPDQTVTRNASLQHVSAFATRLSPGPAKDNRQQLSFIVSTDNPSLFSIQPSVSSNGALAYQPAHNATGSATITVTLKDDGGTDYGGSNTSQPQTFTITVNQVNKTPPTPSQPPTDIPTTPPQPPTDVPTTPPQLVDPPTLDPPNPVNIPPVDIDPPTQTPLPPTPPPIPPSIDLNPGLITFVIELPAQTAPPPYVITLLPPSLPPCQPIMDPPSLLPPASEPLSPSSLEIDLELFTGRFTFDDANPIEADLLTGNNGVSFNSTLPAFSAPPNLSACILTAFTPTRRPTPTAFIVRTTTPSLPAVVPASSTSPASPDPVLPLSASPSPSPAIFNLTNPISSIFSSPDPLSITPHDPLTLTRTVLS